jgi:FecR protein
MNHAPCSRRKDGRRALRLTVAFIGCLAASAGADPLKEATFTQVVNQVQIVSPAQSTSAAQVGRVFRAPDAVRTGPSSRAELRAADDTLTRVGANTVFRWGQEPRTIFLDQGNVLFYSPSGKGGGTIKTAAASAGVLGSTFIVSATRNGGFKVLALQHRTRVNLGGRIRVLNPGQLSFILPGQQGAPAVFEFRLANQVQGSELIRGFGTTLPSMPAILTNAERQEREIAQGSKQATSMLIGEANGDGVELFDSNARQAFFDQVAAEQIVEISEEERFLNATQSDLFVTEADVPLDFVFLVDQSEALAQLNSFSAENDLPPPEDVSGTSFALVIARNIFIQTDRVDLSVFSETNGLGFFTLGAINFERSTAFVNYESGILFVAESINFTPGIGLSFGESGAEADSVEFLSSESMNLRGVGISAPGAELLLLSSNGDLTFGNGTIVAGDISFVTGLGGGILIGGSRLASEDTLDIFAGGNVGVGDSTLLARSSLTVSGESLILNDVRAGSQGDIFFEARSGNLQVNTAAVLQTDPNSIIDIEAPQGNILWKANTTIHAGVLNLTANQLIALDGISAAGSLLNAAQINMDARTIVLANINFAAGSQVLLRSQVGFLAPNPNTNAASLPGHVNFKINVLYGGNPAQNEVPSSQGGTSTFGGNIQMGTLP